MPSGKIGLWLVGARGGVGGTAILGLAALKRRAVPNWGLVSSLPQFVGLDFADWAQFVVGGHEVRDTRLADGLQQFARQTGAFPTELVELCREDLEKAEERIRWGTLIGVGPTIESLASHQVPREEYPWDAIERIESDLQTFSAESDIERTIVINVASTEPPVDPHLIPPDWNALESRLKQRQPSPVPASTLYAIAAIRAGCAYLNFTPSIGPALSAVQQLAESCGTAYMGCDGKTGETLLKSVLAPLFAQRNLQVLSWVGHNIFGNLDGKVLDDPRNKAAKVSSKDRVVKGVLGYKPQTHVSIEYIESLGDWKTAWDHIHFAGFFGTKMILQFIWQGCDSVLAAPLVLDLARWTDLAVRCGEKGPLGFLASFFKSPYGVEEHDFHKQFQMLEAWAATCRLRTAEN